MHRIVRTFYLIVVFIFATAASAADSAVQKPLILAIHPYLPREEIVSRFTPIANYIAAAIGRPVEVRVGRNYAEHIDAVGTGIVDIAYMGPAPYVDLVAKYGNKPLLARQEVNGQSFLIGKIFVRQDSTIKSLKDLKSKRFAFGSSNSTMGHIVPQHMLENAGVTLDSLASHKFIVGHKNVALAVLAGDYDAGAVKDEVFQEFAPKGLRALAQSSSVADHLFVASARLPDALIESLRRSLLNLNDSPNGKEIMTAIHPHMTRLAPPKDSDYDSLRIIMRSPVASIAH